MNRPIGLSVLLVDPNDSTANINKRLKSLMEKTPAGRCCAVIYELPQKWEESKPIESISLSTVLGAPKNRSEHNDWEFFASLATRLCKPQESGRKIDREIGIIIFVKKGEKIYERRHNASPHLIEESLLPTLHPVFTRDVANNIWHMKSSRSFNQIIDRLSGLLSWADEHTLISKGSDFRSRPRAKPDYDNDLIGLPQKEDYEWVTKQPALPFPA